MSPENALKRENVFSPHVCPWAKRIATCFRDTRVYPQLEISGRLEVKKMSPGINTGIFVRSKHENLFKKSQQRTVLIHLVSNLVAKYSKITFFAQFLYKPFKKYFSLSCPRLHTWSAETIPRRKLITGGTEVVHWLSFNQPARVQAPRDSEHQPCSSVLDKSRRIWGRPWPR